MKINPLLNNKSYLALLLIAVLLSTACKKKAKKETIVEDVFETTATVPKKIKILLEPKNGTQTTGQTVFKAEGGSVTMTAIVSGLTRGEHHVYLLKKKTHKLFIGNLIADENGNGTIAFTSEHLCIGCGDAKKDILENSVIVITEADNVPQHASDTNISCAGIIQ